MTQCETSELVEDYYAELARKHVVKILRGSYHWLRRFMTGIKVEYVEEFTQQEYKVIMTVHMDERKAHQVGEMLKEIKRRVKHMPTGSYMRVTHSNGSP
jgi:hypothetical protein